MTKALVILCGGDSSRMGTNKALLPFSDKTMVEYIIDKYQPYYDKIYLSVNERGDYASLNLEIPEIPDIYRNAGPIGAILSSLTMIREDRAFFMSVDTPFMDPVIGSFLLDVSGDYDITTFKMPKEYLDNICGVYGRRCISALGKCIISHTLTRSAIQARCYSNLLDLSEIEKISPVAISQQFFTIKDRDDYYMALFSLLKGNFI